VDREGDGHDAGGDMAYSVKEAFLTLAGEEANTGRPAVFCRFSFCNLWSGREEDRSTATCRFCDTRFVGTDGPGGGRFATADDLADRVRSLWPGDPFAVRPRPLCVCTGGEPLLQLDGELVLALRRRGFEVAVETNGTRPLPATRPDWVTVSPKARAELVLKCGDELKLVYPQVGAEPEKYIDLDFSRFYLQPMDGPTLADNTGLAIDHCMMDSRWSLSVQVHKFIGIP
jgi:7-carboxy-7-deazaguanine synthase (Cx14CxxC type)